MKLTIDAVANKAGDVEAGLIEARRPSPLQPRRQLVLGMPSDRIDTRATRAVIGILVDEIARMIGKREWIAQPGADLRRLDKGPLGADR